MHCASCSVVWWNINWPSWLSHPTAQIWHFVISDFSQIKITFEREEISNCWWDARKYMGSWWWLGELCGDPRCLLWRALRYHSPAYMFLVSCIFFNEWLYFSNHMAGYLLDRPSYIHIFFFYDFLIEFIHVVACIDSLFLLRRNILLYECIIIYYLAGNRFWFLLNLGLRWVRLLGTFEDEYMWGPIFISFG